MPIGVLLLLSARQHQNKDESAGKRDVPGSRALWTVKGTGRGRPFPEPRDTSLLLRST